jgi:NADH-quinone oxidoreductase subunit N
MLGQLDTFVGPEVQWFALSPLLVLLGGALLLLVVGALTPLWPKRLYAIVTAVTAGTAGTLAIVLWDDISDDGPMTLVGGALALDTFAMFLTITICVGLLLVVMLADEYLRGTVNDGPELYSLFIVAALGGIVMASANDLIVLFLGLETLSLALYVLAASNRSSSESAESGLKYFVLGGFASALFLYGIALVYGATGTTNIGEMVVALQGGVDPFSDETLVLAGLALIIVGLGFKVAAVPFHLWTADVYQGAPSPVTAFLASVSKAAAFAAMVRVLVVALPFYRDDWVPIIWVLALLSLVVGSALAIVQDNVKRMLAYSSISHAGFILVGLEAAGQRAGDVDPGPGVPSMALYLLLYSILVIGSIAVVTVVARGSLGSSELVSFSGLARRRPALSLGFTVLLLAQAGVPFTSGFIAKFGVIRAAVEVESYALAVIAMVTAVVAAFFYLRVVATMWTGDPDETAAVLPVPFAMGAVIAVSVVATIVLGIVPGWLIDAADQVTQYAR